MRWRRQCWRAASKALRILLLQNDAPSALIDLAPVRQVQPLSLLVHDLIEQTGDQAAGSARFTGLHLSFPR
jgi:hypothetical protein